jgi:hypothetical protein
VDASASGGSTEPTSSPDWRPTEEHLELNGTGLSGYTRKRLLNYGKSPFLMGKSTISIGSFSIAILT